MSFKVYDFECPKCQYTEERSIDFRGCDTEQDRVQAMKIVCPNCEHPEMEVVWRSAPAVGGPRYGTDAEISKMKKSFKDRFIRKEVDDVRHKFGKLYDDSVRSAAAQKIKKETTE